MFKNHLTVLWKNDLKDLKLRVLPKLMLMFNGVFLFFQMDYINTSHPNFVGGSKAVEIAMQQVKSSKIATISRPKVYL